MPPPDPIMPFLAAVAGILAGMALLALLLAPSGGRRALAAAAAPAATAAALVAVSVIAVPHVYHTFRGLRDQRTVNLTKGTLTQRVDCLTRAGQPDAVEFVRWLRRELPTDARYELQMTPMHAPCVSIGLLPRVNVEEGRGDYVVFFGTVTPRWQAFFDSGFGVERFDQRRRYGYARTSS